MKTLFKSFYKTFLKGLLGILPLALSIYILIWFFRILNGLSINAIAELSKIFPQIAVIGQIPGLGIICGLIIIYLLGLLLTSKWFTSLFHFIQAPLKKFPLIKTVYSAIGDLMFFFGNDEGKTKILQPVRIKDLGFGYDLIGLLTREDCTELGFNEDTVGVFVPMSYMLGGQTIFISKKKIEKLDLTVEFTMKSAIIAWMKASNKKAIREAVTNSLPQNPS